MDKIKIIIDYMNNWQTLFGALIGGLMPITFWFFTEWRRKIKERKENLYYIERALVLNINIVISSYRAIDKFLKENLQLTIDSVSSAEKAEQYSLDRAFVPFFLSKSIDKDLLHLNSGSVYIDNKINQIQHMSEDYSISIDDLRNQFESVVKNNRMMVVAKVNPPDIQSAIYKKNLEDFVSVTEKSILQLNSIEYLKILIRTRIASQYYEKVGSIRWKIKFNPKYSFFVTNKKYKESLNLIHDKIEKYFEKEFEKEFSDIFKKMTDQDDKNVNV